MAGDTVQVIVLTGNWAVCVDRGGRGVSRIIFWRGALDKPGEDFAGKSTTGVGAHRQAMDPIAIAHHAQGSVALSQS